MLILQCEGNIIQIGRKIENQKDKKPSGQWLSHSFCYTKGEEKTKTQELPLWSSG